MQNIFSLLKGTFENKEAFEKKSITFLKGCIIFYCFIMLIFFLSNEVRPTGEYDDYMATTASLINDGNATISTEDLQFAGKIFSAPVEAGYRNTTLVARTGGDMPAYFPLYSLLCVPFTLLLCKMNILADYAFPLTNLFLVVISLYIILLKSTLPVKKRAILLLLIAISPVIFYYSYASSEVFIFSCCLLSMAFWMDRRYCLAAFLISLAGTMNPTIMAMGIVMIVDYFINMFHGKGKFSFEKAIKMIKENFKHIILFGLSFCPIFISFAYNYYQIGYFSVIARGFSPAAEQNWLTQIIGRAWAYWTDLNLGLFPYFSIILILSIILLVFAVIKRNHTYLLLFCGAIFTSVLFSMMIHINSGMFGISRYGFWLSPVLIVGVVYYYDLLLPSLKKLHGMFEIVVFGASTMLICVIIISYGPQNASRVPHISMTPIAKYVLDREPSLYNPLYSTFNSRVNHVDGGYQYVLPIVYSNDDGEVRKILCSSDTIEEIMSDYLAVEKDESWWNTLLESKFSEEGTFYINIPPSRSIHRKETLGEMIWFYGDERNIEKYITSGIGVNEGTIAWTDGDSFEMRLRPEGVGNEVIVHLKIAGVYNAEQRLIVKNNGKVVFSETINSPRTIAFDAYRESTDDRFIIEFLLPDAIAPSSISDSTDSRKLALKLDYAYLTE